MHNTAPTEPPVARPNPKGAPSAARGASSWVGGKRGIPGPPGMAGVSFSGYASFPLVPVLPGC